MVVVALPTFAAGHRIVAVLRQPQQQLQQSSGDPLSRRAKNTRPRACTSSYVSNYNAHTAHARCRVAAGCCGNGKTGCTLACSSRRLQIYVEHVTRATQTTRVHTSGVHLSVVVVVADAARWQRVAVRVALRHGRERASVGARVLCANTQTDTITIIDLISICLNFLTAAAVPINIYVCDVHVSV